MIKDPRQFLLLHGEKIVFAAMALLLVLVIWAYHPWDVDVREAGLVGGYVRTGEDVFDGNESQIEKPVPAALQELERRLTTPYSSWNEPRVYGNEKNVFFAKGGGTVGPSDEKPEKDPPVRPIQHVYAKADKERVIVVFKIDDAAQRQTLVSAGMGDITQGLPIERIEIIRIDDKGNEVPVTPDLWLPQNMPKDSAYGEEAPRSMNFRYDDGPVYIYAQRRPSREPNEDEIRRQMEERQKMEDEARKQAEEMMRKQREAEDARRKAAEQEATKGPGPRTTPPPPRTADTTTPGPRPPRRPPARRGKVTDPVQLGYFYFIDSSRLDPARAYRYKVIIYCQNPVKGAKNRTVQSREDSTEASNEVKVQSFKEWYFIGGSALQGQEVATCRIRTFIGGSKEITPERISGIIAEFAPEEVDPGTTAAEDSGIWVEQTDNVRPGEEIGRAQTKDDREVDFSTGCQVVAIDQAVQVLEEKETVRKLVDGEMKSIEVLRRRVFPSKLRLSYIDADGAVKTRWIERAPAARPIAAK